MSELDVFGFPVQIGKVQPPLLPETLQRDRLLDWMAAKIHSRLVLIVADAGYGKTTLLADWSRRTRLRTLWYRLDETDRDWVVFVNHIVAAGREIDADFAPNTMSLIRELGAGLGDRAAIVRTLLAEIRRWVVGGTVLILDDYHVIDDVPDVREIVRELLVHGPERLSIVISTRRLPTLPLARLRALGEVAELSTDDLRFDHGEMERLFRDTYGHPLERDLLDDLARTTEGWAATLRLVETAVRGRSRTEVRAVVKGLSARHGDLHDYLAEEVVGRMPVELQDFLERCALLQVAVPQLAAVAASVSVADARRLLDEVEAAGLLSRRGRTGQAGRLLHPLVRSFLEGRLLDSVGDDGVAAIHARIAAAAEPASWWLAGHHYAAAGRMADVARVLSTSLEAILGSGGAQAAVELMAAGEATALGGWFEVLAARAYLREGRVVQARDSARRALAQSDRGDPTIPLAVALATLTTVEYNGGEYDAAVNYAKRLSTAPAADLYLAIAAATLAMADSMVGGSIPEAERVLSMTADLALRQGHAHYFGISHLNLAWLARGSGDADRILRSSQLSLDALAATSAGPEMDTVHTVAAWAYGHIGDADRALAEVEVALNSPFLQGRFEILMEAADAIGTYVDPARGASLVAEAEAVGPSTTADATYSPLVRAETLIRIGEIDEAIALIGSVPRGRYTGYPAFYVRLLVALAEASLLSGSADTPRLLDMALEQADLQGATGPIRAIRLLKSLESSPSRASNEIVALSVIEPGLIAAHAEGVLARLGEISDDAADCLFAAAVRNPRRWIGGLRRILDRGSPSARWRAGRILEIVGERSDVKKLRTLSRELKGQYRTPALGRGLARRTADRVWVEDQGRISIRIGSRVVAGTDIRRKPLALMCYLLTRPAMSATRDQVLDALWPDTDPSQAVNSLHQTVYFLRRVIEPAYSDDLSPGYVNQDSELLWLDPELITSRSIKCREMIRSFGPEPSHADALELAREYRGRFALDFAYEDWASTYRESLHAQYLEVTERAIASATKEGQAADALEIARLILDADPALDQVEVSLVKMYRLLGAHSAAAEQYQHYSTVLREELGIDAPPLDQL